MATITDDEFVRLFQERAGLETVDGWAGAETLAALDKVYPPIPAVVRIPMPAEYWPMLSRIESNDRPYVKASTSSGSGLFQFLKATWIGEGGAWGDNPALAFGGLKPSPGEQLDRVKTLTQRNAVYLDKAGIAINPASLYAAHFLGMVTAAAVILADVKARADFIAGPAATKANPSILQGKTVADFLTWLHKKTGAWAH